MKSRITIEVDFDNGQPYIKVVNDNNSDDVRDKLITFFRQRFGYSSSWCKVVYPMFSEAGPIQFHLQPIRPDQLAEEAVIMTEQARLLKENEKIPAVAH